MNTKKNIFAIIGSATRNSANEKLMEYVAKMTEKEFNITIFADLKLLPHFDPELSSENTPEIITQFRNDISNADGIIICTPEYIFSIPSGLKNAIEWCVSTTVFSNKPTGLITASANGQKAHEEVQLIMQTVMANFTPETTLLIQGIKGKVNQQGELSDDQTKKEIIKFTTSFKALLK